MNKMGLNSIFCTLFSILLVGCPQSATARTLYVSSSGSNDTDISWDNAFRSVSDAIENATAGDSIWVASGRYNESIRLIPHIHLFGGFRGGEDPNEFDHRNWRSYETILDATGLNTTVVVGANGCSIEGFVVTNGRGGITDSTKGGGGIECLSLENMIISNCRVESNTAFLREEGNSLLGGVGGGILVIASNVCIDSCELVSNRGQIHGGGIGLIGGNLVLQNSFIDKNIGSGITKQGGGSLLISQCTFGIFNTSPSDPEWGPDISIRSGQPDSVSVFNCIVRQEPINAGLNTSYSNIPGIEGAGNIDCDPQWIEPEAGNYRLGCTSPCIDSASIEGLATDLDGNHRPVDVIGVGRDGLGAFDMGCYEFQLLPADLDSNGKVNSSDLLIFQQEWMAAQ